MGKIIGLSLTGLALGLTVGCGIFGSPGAKAGSCYAYCLEVTITSQGEPLALCYGTEAELQAARRAYEARGVRVTVRQ
jgi:hypothetical protein